MKSSDRFLTRSRVRLLALALLSALIAQPATSAKPSKVPNITWETARMDSAMEGRIDKLVAKAIEHGDMSGCVVLIGRRDGIVFERAYGNRSVEPDKEPMTPDTLFDMASITKPVATATSAMILLERGQLRLNDNVAKYFPEFAANGKETITVEQLLVHASGLIPDNPLADYSEGWTSAKPKICELETLSEPGTKFKYSDVNFILLGKIIESASGKPLNEFVKEEVLDKLGMRNTGYLPSDELKARAETTEKRDGKWLKGEVHDPRAAKMDGVAGHAGLFSTASDMAIYAQMMLQGGRYGDARILGPVTFEEMTQPRDVAGHLRGLGWDKQSGYSRNRGEMMTDLAFGHGGFTGTAMWIDPGLDLYVIFLGNRLHPDGKGEVNNLAGRIGTIACSALLDVPKRPEARPVRSMAKAAPLNVLAASTNEKNPSARERKGSNEPSPSPSLKGRGKPEKEEEPQEEPKNVGEVKGLRLGIDVLIANEFKPLQGKRIGLITNQTGLDSVGVTTIDRLYNAPKVKLVSLFSPEHGIRGELDHDGIADSLDAKTGLPIYSLYGKRRWPTQLQLEELDALVFDVQDIGARYYTNTATMALSMKAAAEAGKEFFVLDRPDPIGGELIEGPLLEGVKESFVGIHNIPIRYGLTIGELAKMYAKERELNVKLTVVRLEGWRRGMYQFDTEMTWVNTSPNMRSLRAAVLYPGVGVMEFTNVSVGRGTGTPFELMGAPWINERDLAHAVNAAKPPGVRVLPIRFTPTASKFKDQECRGLSIIITDWKEFKPFEFGVVIMHSLHKLYPRTWEPQRLLKLLGNKSVYQQIVDGADVATILEHVKKDVEAFRERRKEFLLYP